MLPSQGLGNPAASHSHSDPRRPGTSRAEGARPGTSFGGQYGQYGDHHGADQFQQHGVGGQYGIVEEEYEEESDDEDVFAFLPPSTADAANEAESSGPVGGPVQNLAPVTNFGAAEPQNQVYYYPTLQAHANNPFAYSITSGPIDDSREPPSTADTLDLPPPTTMDSSMEPEAFAFEPPTNTPYPSHYPYPIGPPPLSPPSSDMDSQPSTGYGHPRGSDAFKLEKRSSSSEQAAHQSVGDVAVRKTSVINEDPEEGAPTRTSEEGVAVPVKDLEGKGMETKVPSREEDLGVDVDLGKVSDQTEAYDADLERGPGERISERISSRGRKKSRNEKRSAKKSGSGLASGGDVPTMEGESTGLRKRKNLNAGPYLNYPHLNEKSQGGRSGRGEFFIGLIIFLLNIDQSRNGTYSGLTGDNFAYLPYQWNDRHQRECQLGLPSCASKAVVSS